MTTITHETVRSTEEFAKRTSFCGELSATYDRIVEVFGEPTPVDVEEKTRVEWAIIIDIAGQPLYVCIYDWKEYGRPVEQVTSWSVACSVPEGFNLVDHLVKS